MTVISMTTFTSPKNKSCCGLRLNCTPSCLSSNYILHRLQMDLSVTVLRGSNRRVKRDRSPPAGGHYATINRTEILRTEGSSEDGSSVQNSAHGRCIAASDKS